MNYWSFLAKFAAWAFGLFVLWHAVVADWYVTLMTQIGPFITAAVTGSVPEIQGTGRGARVFFAYGRGRIGVHIETLCVGLLPFLALVAATGIRTIGQRLQMAGIGTAVLFVFHLSMFAAYPFFLSRSGLIVDSLGAFWVILGLVGFPFLLWLILLRVGQPPPPD